MKIVKYAGAHAFVTAAVWLGPLPYAAFGLGFKDKEKWSLLDHLVSTTALPVADALTAPGRYISSDGPGGFLIPALITSLSWGAIIAAAVEALNTAG